MGLLPHPAQQGSDELDPHRSPHHPIYMMVDTPLAEQFGMLLDEYKVIYDRQVNAYALFNETTDLGERYNLMDIEPARAQRMIERLDSWRAAQLTFYSNGLIEKESYAPVLPDPK